MDARATIENLIYTYAERIDAGDFDGVGALFAKGRFRSGDGPALTGEQLAAANRALIIVYEDGTPRTRHVTTNVITRVDGDRGSARSAFTVMQGVPGRPIEPLILGRYHDEFARDAEGWHFTSRIVLVDVKSDLSRHLTQPDVV